jgi:hypothetical protein
MGYNAIHVHVKWVLGTTRRVVLEKSVQREGNVFRAQDLWVGLTSGWTLQIENGIL